jgi:hypothetical protein
MSEDSSDFRLTQLEASHQDLRQSHTSLYADYMEFKRNTQQNVDRLQLVLDARADLSKGFEKVNASLNNITTSALQSAPEWVIQSMERKSAIISILCAIATGVIAALITTLVHH